jgi:hypothetical protein
MTDKTRRSLASRIISRTRRGLAAVVLLTFLAQISLFFIGIMDPYTRTRSLWGKSLEQRRGIVCGVGMTLKQIADQFPIDSKIYLIHPQAFVHMNAVYSFYPRTLSVTMSNRRYNTDQEYAAWDEVPSWQWLQTNGFTYVLDFRNGGRRWDVRPGLVLE